MTQAVFLRVKSCLAVASTQRMYSLKTYYMYFNRNKNKSKINRTRDIRGGFLCYSF